MYTCKMCGGKLQPDARNGVGTCLYCGTEQTIPKTPDAKRAALYERANYFRINSEYDKAMALYEQILNESPEESEAYWNILLCRYGVEYVEDPATHKRVPTVNRMQNTAVLADADYKSALQYASDIQRKIYEAQATEIQEIYKGILAISQKAEPYDVFICYKETDQNGRRTHDSVLAQEIYNELCRENHKVFFARITLEDKLGEEYEPYIFAALNSAKVMVVVGNSAEHLNAPWVKNEWSRFLVQMKGDTKKFLIPAYKNMDPYQLPEEFSHLQAQDMSKVGAVQDLVHGITKLIGKHEQDSAQKEVVILNPFTIMKEKIIAFFKHKATRISLVLAAILAVIAGGIITVYQTTVVHITQDGVKYQKISVYEEDGTRFKAYSIYGYTDDISENVVIPAEIKEKPVVIYYWTSAFDNCTKIKSITFSDGVKCSNGYSHFYEFKGCSSLKSLTLPASMLTESLYFSENSDVEFTELTLTGEGPIHLSLYKNAFSSLEKLTISGAITSLGASFHECTALKKVVVNDLATWCGMSFSSSSASPFSTGASLYVGETLITEAVIPASVTAIGDYAFYGYAELTKVSFAEGSQLKSIGASAFDNCSALTEISIPPSVTSIGASAFAGCDGLQRVTISDVAAWCALSFEDFSSNPLRCASHLYLGSAELTELVIPASVTRIEDHAFYGCNSLRSLRLEDGSQLTYIGESAFSGCSNISADALTIPTTVTHIGAYAFEGVDFIGGVTFANTSSWHVSKSAAVAQGEAMDVSNPATNAQNLYSNYSSYYWKRG